MKSVRCTEAAQEATLLDYFHEVDHMADRLARLEAALDAAVQAAPAPMRTVIAALQALRGVAQVSAATIVAELGQVSRFGRPRQLMSYSDTVASEHSSGDRIRRGGITKTGNAHLRRIVIEAAWAYRHRPARGRALLKRQQPVSEEVKAIAWKAQHRLHARYRTLTARGKSKQQVVTAVGRELLGFIWAIGTTVEAEAGRTRPVAASPIRRTGHGMTVAVERQTNRRTLVAFYAAGLQAGSARLVRGSSRRMTTMRSRPAYIRVINRRRSRSVATDMTCPKIGGHTKIVRSN